MFEIIFEQIKSHDTIIIHRHKNPDGDALGSQIGLKRIIKDNFPEKKVYAVGDPAGRYAFMDDSTMDVISDDIYSDALAIVLDTSAAALISDVRYTSAKTSARIDHHIFVEKICDYEVTDTSYESCCGLITSFAIESGLDVSRFAAKSLYTGMITDSGRFRYDSTSAKTFKNAAFLIDKGFNTGDIYRNLYSDDFSFIRLRAEFVLKVNFTSDKVAYIYTTLDEAKNYPADTFTISRGMVGVMSEIRGVDIWVNFTETEAGVLCEIRSSVHNINRIAVKYGGGGHEKASGATLKNRSEAMDLLADLNEIVRNAK